MGRRWAQWVGDDLLFRLGVTPVCKCCIRTPWENERLPTAASKRNRNVKTLWCCNVRIWNVGSDRLMVLISFGWIREQCHLAYIMTEEWSPLPSTLRCGAAAGRADAASYCQPAGEDGAATGGRPACPAVPSCAPLCPGSCALSRESETWLIKEQVCILGQRQTPVLDVSRMFRRVNYLRWSRHIWLWFTQNISLCALLSIASSWDGS